MTTTTEQPARGICPNCQQWQWPTNDARSSDCLHECRKRGFAPAAELHITPTEHDKREWSRMAQAAYREDRNDIGHRFSMASASTPIGGSMLLSRYDALMKDYRAWLVFNQWPNA